MRMVTDRIPWAVSGSAPDLLHPGLRPGFHRPRGPSTVPAFVGESATEGGVAQNPKQRLGAPQTTWSVDHRRYGAF